jgi:hypothetical protein
MLIALLSCVELGNTADVSEIPAAPIFNPGANLTRLSDYTALNHPITMYKELRRMLKWSRTI